MNDVLASYAIGESLATLPLGELRAATQAGRPDRLAVLLVAPELARESQFDGVLRRESAALRTARAPHLAPLVEVGRRDATLYVVFTRPEGRTLAERLAAGEGFTPQQTALLIQCIADAVDAAHRHGLVHGLIAPETIFVADDGSATLLGAGLLAAVDEAGLGDAIGGRVGLRCIAPKQASGGHAVASADGYAIGALAYLLLIGVAPPDAIDDADPFDDLAAGATSAATDPFALTGAVLRRQRNIRPELRYPSCAAFARALSAVLAGAELPPEEAAGHVDSERHTPTNGSATAPVRAAPPRATLGAREPGVQSTRLRPMPPALVAGVHAMRENTGDRFPPVVVTAVGVVVVCLIAIGLSGRGWFALTGLGIVAFVVAMLVVGIVEKRGKLARDLQFGQIREAIGPAQIERHVGKHTIHYLCLPDLERIQIPGKLYAQLEPLAQKEPDPGFFTRIMRSETVHRIPWLTAILLSESNLVVEVRDAADRVVYREPALRGIDLDR